MKWDKFAKTFNFGWYQAVWFTAILGREALEPLLAVLLLLHLVLVQRWRQEAKIMIACAFMGIAADSVLHLQGIHTFSPAPTWLPVPLWLMGLWFGFAGTLRHSLSYLMERPRLASLAASVAAPLSYFAGERFGAVTFMEDQYITAAAIGLSWAVLMPVFTMIVRQVTESRAKQLETSRLQRA